MKAKASESGVIVVYGSIKKTTDALCPMRPFQYYFGGDYRSSKGAIVNFGACLESVAIPLFESLHDPIRPIFDRESPAINRVVDAEKLLEKNVNRLMKMRFQVNNTADLKGALGTLLSLVEVK